MTVQSLLRVVLAGIVIFGVYIALKTLISGILITIVGGALLVIFLLIVTREFGL